MIKVYFTNKSVTVTWQVASFDCEDTYARCLSSLEELAKECNATMSESVMMDMFDEEICVHCDKDCSFGSGRYVNRYSYYGDEVRGYVCGVCHEENEILMDNK